MGVKSTISALILDATAAGRSILTAANAAAQKTLLSLVKGDVGLGNVDNTSDANKPVSTDQQTALDAKQATLVSGTNIKTVGGSSLLGSGNISVGSGDVVGPSSATDNAIAAFDGTTGKLIQNRSVTINDNGVITTPHNIVCASGVSGEPAIYATGSGTMVRLQRTGLVDLGIGEASGNTFAVRNNGTGLTMFSVHATTFAAAFLGELVAAGLMCVGVYTFATVPSASSNTGKFLRISDRAQKHAYSDGTNWRFFGDDAVIS